jgi:hypothetical protein
MTLSELDWHGSTVTREVSDAEWNAKKIKLQRDSFGYTNWIEFKHGYWRWYDVDRQGRQGSSGDLDCD